MVLLTISQPAAAWWPDILNPVTWYEEAVDYFSDNVKGVLQLTWDVVTLDPEDAWEDIKDIAYNHVCFGSLTVVGLAVSAGLEEDFDECDVPPHPIEPDILAKLSLYFNSDFNSVRIHEGCNLDADVVPGNEAPTVLRSRLANTFISSPRNITLGIRKALHCSRTNSRMSSSTAKRGLATSYASMG